MDDNLAKLIAETTNKAYSQGIDHAVKVVTLYLNSYFDSGDSKTALVLTEIKIKLEELKRINED